MPKLVAAAVKFKPKDCEYFQIACGKHHSDIFEMLFNLHIAYEKELIQGFITDEDTFVDRYEAFAIARAEDQLLPEAKEDYKNKLISALFSEDVW